jgi:hypothetical protein
LINAIGAGRHGRSVPTPGDPKECRQHALNCVHLAKSASTPELRDHFAKLARTWIRVADELEQSEALLAEIDVDEVTKQTAKRKPRRVRFQPGLFDAPRDGGFAGERHGGAHLSS